MLKLIFRTPLFFSIFLSTLALAADYSGHYVSIEDKTGSQFVDVIQKTPDQVQFHVVGSFENSTGEISGAAQVRKSMAEYRTTDPLYKIRLKFEAGKIKIDEQYVGGAGHPYGGAHTSFSGVYKKKDAKLTAFEIETPNELEAAFNASPPTKEIPGKLSFVSKYPSGAAKEVAFQLGSVKVVDKYDAKGNRTDERWHGVPEYTGNSELGVFTANPCCAWVSLPRQGKDGALRSLFDALARKDITSAKTALKNGADIEGRDDHGSTPLMIAAMYSSLEGVKLLLDSGANVNALGAEPGNSKKLKADETALWRAIQSGRIEILRLMLDRGADLTIGGASAVRDAVSRIEVGRDPKTKTVYTEMIDVLLDAGAAAAGKLSADDKKSFSQAAVFIGKPEKAKPFTG